MIKMVSSIPMSPHWLWFRALFTEHLDAAIQMAPILTDIQLLNNIQMSCDGQGYQDLE